MNKMKILHLHLKIMTHAWKLPQKSFKFLRINIIPIGKFSSLFSPLNKILKSKALANFHMVYGAFHLITTSFVQLK